eukprot:m.160519 g.160519  ORF g.160519 m.160519 type:complete len:139 (+) comp9850_c1_seq11:1554-1970(+)
MQFTLLRGSHTRDIYDNRLTSVGLEFSELSAVEQIDLYQNSITLVVPWVFSQLRSISRMALMQNKLGWIPAGTFAGLALSHELLLYGNQLTWVEPGAFAGSSCNNIDLSNNNITAIPAGMMANSPGLTRVYASADQQL